MDKYSTHEALDRTSNIIDIIDRHLLEHHYFLDDSNIEDKIKIKIAIDLLHQVYQSVGAKHFETD